MKKSVQIRIAILALSLIVAAWADISIAPPPEQSWESGTTTITLSGDTLTIGGWGTMENRRFDHHPPWYHACSSVTNLVIEKGVTLIRNYAFSGCANVTSITVRRRSPPAVCFRAFISVNLNNASLYVPVGSAYAYRNARGWEIFDRVNDIGSHTAADILWLILAGFFIYGFISWMYLLLYAIFKKIHRKENSATKTPLKIISSILCLIICGIWIMLSYHDVLYDVIMLFVLMIFSSYGFVSLIHRLFQFIFNKIFRGEHKTVKILLKVISVIFYLIICVFWIQNIEFMIYFDNTMAGFLIFYGFFFYGMTLSIYRSLFFVFTKIRCEEENIAIKSTLTGISVFLGLTSSSIYIFWIMSNRHSLRETAFFVQNYTLFFIVSFISTAILLLHQLHKYYRKKTIKLPTTVIILTTCHAVLLAALFIMRWI
ncbi:MAG: hypothetical protein LBU83_02545 [Bacteroidales bacterium]|nr:hypothetical protein [Bacteroidales bacterium]